MATKSYSIGPQDGWTKIVASGHFASLRVSAYPHTHPFFIFGDPTAVPVVGTDNGVLTCHHPFKITAGDRLNVDAFYVRVQSPVSSNPANDGRLRLDVYTDGGTLA
jgi:hypothetical protein